MRRFVAASLAALVTTLIGMALVSPSAMAACGRVNGTSTTGGIPSGSNPVKYEYANSPYLGVQYDCPGDVVRLYYGGYTNGSHYNLRYCCVVGKPRQIEVSPGLRRVYTLNASLFHTDTGGSRVTVNVQICNRGTGLFSTSTCSRFSPTVGVPVTPTT